MNMWIIYGIIAVILVIAELVYFRIADKCNIIDKPNERSSHSTIVLRGGGVIFAISMLVWAIMMAVQGGQGVQEFKEFNSLRRLSRTRIGRILLTSHR